MKIRLLTPIIVLLLITCRAACASPEPRRTDPAHSLEITLGKISIFHKFHHYHDDITLRAFVEHQIMPYFSFTELAHRAAGPYARHMSADDITDFSTRLRIDFFSMLMQHLGNFDPYRTPVQIEKTRYSQPGLATVVTRIYLYQKVPLVLNFRMRLIHHRWNITDIQSNGLSLAMYYRSRYIDRLRAYGHLAQ